MDCVAEGVEYPRRLICFSRVSVRRLPPTYTTPIAPATEFSAATGSVLSARQATSGDLGGLGAGLDEGEPLVAGVSDDLQTVR